MFHYFNDYSGKWEEYKCPEWYMLYRISYYRRIRTGQERRRWYQDKDYVRLRGRRSPYRLDSWCELENTASCMVSKSWKKLYKRRKQFK